LALERKVDVVPLSRYSRVLPIRPGIQIGFAAVDPQSIAFGVRILAEVFDKT
jgi:GntR family transcriptional regulator / MocR family aminotransferase